MDVKSLYRKIPYSEGISAAYESYQERSVATKVIITFLALILTLKNFMFSYKNYLQLRGCVMVTAFAPGYENIFMARFEQKHIYPFIKDKVDLLITFFSFEKVRKKK